MREVIIAKSAGFCWGVKRAFDKVLEIAEASAPSDKLYTLGPLIHNPQAVRELERKGVKVLDEVAGKIGGTVFIRTHGLSPSEREKLRKSGAKIVDATCPDVGIIQGLVRKHVRKGYNIVIIGDHKHPEVKALQGYAEGKGMVVNSLSEAESLPSNWTRICVVAQSTQDEKRFNELVDFLKKRYANCEVFDTICASTMERQDEVKRLADVVDAMVVVGGHNSANTARLAEISRETGVPTFHVETAEELDLEALKRFEKIGITAGSSTPDWLINELVKKLSA